MLPDIDLDDRRFQDLVSEARSRIAQLCPEWTEHNVSDPGITLVEIFAWLTETLIYRVNRVPDKLHIRLLELLGIHPDPPRAALADLRFWLEPSSAPIVIPVGTEVATRGRRAEAVVFRVMDGLTIPALRPVAYAVERGGVVEQLDTDQGVAKPPLDQQRPFGTPPQPNDALYLGFADPLSRLVLRLEFDASPARGAGVDPRDPPLRWEVSKGDGIWGPADVLADETGGFDFGSGTVDLQIPEAAAEGAVGRRRAHWIRCRVSELTAAGYAEASYSAPPDVYSITSSAVGALLPATHGVQGGIETLGTSDGTPGQRFQLRHAPVLSLDASEGLEVREPYATEWQPWEFRETFAESNALDRHYVLDATAGVVELGPAIRETDGSWTQYGAVPPAGSELRMRAYSYGGGRHGNVDAETATVLLTQLDGITAVTNPRPAHGGADAETLEDIRMRAPLMLRSADRAVTAADYEHLCLRASPRVARALCTPATAGGAVRVQLLPRVVPADRQLSFEELVPDERLLADVAEYLDERRPVGVSVDLLPVGFRGISVVASVQALPNADVRRVEMDLAHALYTFVNPLVGGSVLGSGAGWAFGRGLNQGELYGVMQSVEGVAFVRLLRMYDFDLKTGELGAKPTGMHVELQPNELLASGMHLLQVVRD